VIGLSGLTSIAVWLLIEPLILFPRWFLIPLAFLSIALASAVVTAEETLTAGRLVRWSIRIAICAVLLLLLFESRGVVYGFRYAASIDSRAAKYEENPGADVATWLNGNVKAGERVALAGYKGSRYLLDVELLTNSESTDERQWLWDNGEWGYDSYGTGASTAPSGIRSF
jgi:hypothetical protein